MKRTLIASFAALSIGTTALANEDVNAFMQDEEDPVAAVENEVEILSGEFGLEHSHKRLSACKSIELDEAQKSRLMDEIFSFKKTMIDHKAALKKGKLDYVQQVINPSKTLSSIEEISQTILMTKNSINETKMNFGNEILFNILQPEQRKQGLKCMHQIKKMKMKKKCKAAFASHGKHSHGKHKHKHKHGKHHGKQSQD